MGAAVQCVVCLGADHDPDRHPDLLRCRHCGHRFYRGVAEVDSAKLYGIDYHETEEYLDYAGQRETLARNFRHDLDRMERFGTRGGSLLEVGCAYGFFLAEAAPRFDRVHGLDISAPAVAWARAELGVSAQAGEVTQHRPEAPYDVVCMWDTIEHLPHPRRHLAAVARLLRPGGLLFLSTGDAGSLVARLRGRRWRMIHPPTHVHYFTRAGIRLLLESEGFRPLGIESVAGRRRLANVLHNLGRFGSTGLVRRASGWLLRHAPQGALRRDVRIGLGDVMFVAARREGVSDSP